MGKAMNQYVYYSRNGVTVVLDQLNVDGRSYPLKSITSVRLAKNNTGHRIATLLMLVGLVLLVNEGALFVYGALLFLLGILLWISFDAVYCLLIATSEGEKSILENNDIEYVEKILHALDAAMIDSRQNGSHHSG
jgi:Zn-dependent membrane protease YugP